MEKLDIVSLIETNPIIKLNSDYNNKLLNKIKNEFTDDEQKLFLTSFYCYLNYHPTNDFVIDLDNVWKWLGFSQKYNAERILEKHFIINNDYKNLAPQEGKASSKNEKWGGHNKKTVIMNIRTFKLFCLLSETQKAKQIHNYFINNFMTVNLTLHYNHIFNELNYMILLFYVLLANGPDFNKL